MLPSDSEKTLLLQVMEYHRWGWCVIPVPRGTKKVRIRWKCYQAERPDESQLRTWFNGNPCNIAVILGEVSGGLACRDFDAMSEYEQWKQRKPNLAKILPTVQTANGMHVYFVGHIQSIKHIENGELRGSGGYCLLPPSVHPDGPVYQWVNPPKKGNLLFLNPVHAGFMDRFTEQTEQTEKTEHTENTEQIEAMLRVGSVEEAIQETLPMEFGTRNQRIFSFARALQSLPQFKKSHPKQLRDLVKEWHRRALPKIRTKEIEETWIDFLKAWPKIKHPKGEEPMAQIFARALKVEPPKAAVELYPDHNKLQLLAALCRELQRAAGNNPFFLSARTAGKLLETSPPSANDWLFLLVSDGILKLISKGGARKAPRKASRYRYIAD